MTLAGCGAHDADGAADAAEQLYTAAKGGDGAAACEWLSADTREQLEQDEQKPCLEAIVALELSGSRSTKTSAYITEAKVDLDGGDSVFLEETPSGWRVTAAGCKPVPDQEAPYECEVES
ncbi:MAG TPA: hypothetical protein VEX36_04025 [Thermoleophilaceae bacterium]|nr:hypothetical protein [Thermoleophilaceae bacterium]